MFTWKLHDHLAEVDERAERMLAQLTAEMAKREGITETLKAADQMEWVRRMNNINERVAEVICTEIIYVL